MRQDYQPIEIQYVASVGNFHIRYMEMNLAKYKLVDTEPMAVEVTEGELHRMPLFAELFMRRPETQELIVEPQDVQQLLDQILNMQSPQIAGYPGARSEAGPAGKETVARADHLAGSITKRMEMEDRKVAVVGWWAWSW